MSRPYMSCKPTLDFLKQRLCGVERDLRGMDLRYQGLGSSPLYIPERQLLFVIRYSFIHLFVHLLLLAEPWIKL